MIGFLDLPSGLSGDMFLSCLVDAGWPLAELSQVLSSIPLPAASIALTSSSVMRGPIRATLISVKTAETQPRRDLQDVRGLIESADLPQPVRERAIAVFTRLANAEAAVHGTTTGRVHFHEVGALDAIADIVGVCAGLHAMDVERLYASPLPVGAGWAQSAHGMLPLPAPATLELLASVRAPIRPAPTTPPPSHLSLAPEFEIRQHHGDHAKATDEPQPPASAIAPSKQPAPPDPAPQELVTPTAAALLAELAIFEQPAMRLTRVGIGAGQRQFTWPNIARLWLGERNPVGPLVQIDTNIDDMNPQFYSSISERLFSAGALDVWLTPIQMKKGRPAVLLSVLAPTAQEQALASVLLRETTTLGVRVHDIHRHEASREFRLVDTPYGPVRVKLKLHDGQVIGAAPEYDDCKELADNANLPIRIVHEAAQAAAQRLRDLLAKT